MESTSTKHDPSRCPYCGSDQVQRVWSICVPASEKLVRVQYWVMVCEACQRSFRTEA